jgi:hypothetical protein
LSEELPAEPSVGGNNRLVRARAQSWRVLDLPVELIWREVARTQSDLQARIFRRTGIKKIIQRSNIPAI